MPVLVDIPTCMTVQLGIVFMFRPWRLCKMQDPNQHQIHQSMMRCCPASMSCFACITLSDFNSPSSFALCKKPMTESVHALSISFSMRSMSSLQKISRGVRSKRPRLASSQLPSSIANSANIALPERGLFDQFFTSSICSMAYFRQSIFSLINRADSAQRLRIFSRGGSYSCL